MSLNKLFLRSFGVILTGFLFVGVAFADSSESFLPTWKLLSNKDKQQFIAGYLQGLRDAQKITSIASGFVRDNPEKAIDALERLEGLYETKVPPGRLVEGIDAFYSDSMNMDASLSVAVNSLKGRL